MVLYGIVCSDSVHSIPALQIASYFFPLVPVAAMCLEDDCFLFFRPFSLVNLGIQVVVPSQLTTGCTFLCTAFLYVAVGNALAAFSVR